MRVRSTSVVRAIASGAALLGLGACNHDEGEGLFSSWAALSAANNPPTIAGRPKTEVHAGESYVFQPRASDPDGNALTFSIRNKPRWASFDDSTGRLSGRPAPGDAGTASGVVISVSDGTARSAIGPFAIRVDPGQAGPGPIAVDDFANVASDTAVTVPVLANDTDPDGDAIRLVGVDAPQFGTATAAGDGTVTYRAPAGFTGTDRFEYTIDDATGIEATGRITVTVTRPGTGDQLRALLEATPEGAWVKVNANHFQDVWTPVEQRADSNGTPVGEPRKIISAWGSMAWDSRRAQLIIWGGGHADYAGNDVYRFDARTLRWERASLPSRVVAPLGDNHYFTADGAMNAPISSHTYDNQEFLPLLDRFITFGGANYNAGGPFMLDDGTTTTGPYLWDPNRANANMVGGTTGSQVNAARFPDVVGARMWQNRDAVTRNGIGNVRPGSFVNGTSAYSLESGQDVLYVSESPAAGGDLFRYRIGTLAQPALDSWELVGVGNKSYSDQGAGSLDVRRGLYLRTARFSGAYGIVMWNLQDAGPTNAPIRFMPRDSDSAFVMSKLHGMDYDPRRDAFVLWDGGPDVWYLRPPAAGLSLETASWSVERAPVDGATAPDTLGSVGVLGKWRYVEAYDVMMGLGDSYEGAVWVYKPVNWQPQSR